MNLGYLLGKSSRLCRQDLNLRLVEFNLTAAQYFLLKDILHFEKKANPEKYLNPACIAARLNADRPTITGIVTRLLKQNFITKKNNPYDKRSFYLILTEETKKLMPKLAEIEALTLNKAVLGLTITEVSELTQTLNKLINNFTTGDDYDE